MNIINKNEIEEWWWWFRWLSTSTKKNENENEKNGRRRNVNIIWYYTQYTHTHIANRVEYFTHFGSFDTLYSVGISRLSSISTISTSPDWISAVPSHEIIIGIQSAPDVQFSGIWKALNCIKKGYLLRCFYVYLLLWYRNRHLICWTYRTYNICLCCFRWNIFILFSFSCCFCCRLVIFLLLLL